MTSYCILSLAPAFRWLTLAAAIASIAGPSAVGQDKPAPGSQVDIVPTSELKLQEWRYAFEKPKSNWYKRDFSDAKWKKAPAGFGQPVDAKSAVRTKWSTPEIWLRRTFTLTATEFAKPHLRISHNEVVEIYLNGDKIQTLKGNSKGYVNLPLSEKARKSLRKGDNLLAAYSRNKVGKQIIDVGLVDLRPEEKVAQARPNEDKKLEAKAAEPQVVRARVMAWLRDGTQVGGNTLDRLFETAGPTLDGNSLALVGNPIRTLRLKGSLADPLAPCVELTNGDVLYGSVVEHQPLSDDGATAAHFVIMSDRVLPAGIGRYVVQESFVRRILRSPTSRGDVTPGRLLLIDGRVLQVRAVRFAGEEVQCFTSEGVRRLELSEIAEFDLPGRDAIHDILADAGWSAEGDKGTIIRVRTTDGCQITFDRNFTKALDGKTFAVRPNWSLETLVLPLDSFAWITFRDLDEVPLSLLAAAGKANPSPLGHWQWSRSASITQSELRVDPLAAELGLGMHANAELTFDLPSSARQFHGAVGIDEAVGSGGCVQCRVYVNSTDESPLWQSGFLRGVDPPAWIGPLDIRGARRLVLSADMAHQGRPAGADPLDIRDHVDWLVPMLTINASDIPAPVDSLERWIPQLAGWHVPPAMYSRIGVWPVWNTQFKRWEMSLSTRGTPDEPIELTRKLRITKENVSLKINALRDDQAKGHLISIHVNGKPFATTKGDDMYLTNTSWKRSVGRDYNLTPFIGQEVSLSLVLSARKAKSEVHGGIVWRQITFAPVSEPTNNQN